LDQTGGVSFVGHPFPLEEADAHFERLARWGFTCLRFNITWEALEHEGPGIYDEAYLAYLVKLMKSAEKKGISLFIDPHQDVWSRWTGGDGAPAWTLEKLGMDPRLLDAAGAALTQQRYRPEPPPSAKREGSPQDPPGRGFPRMIWPTNYNRYGAATMFTLFFGGNTYAPGVTVDGERVQDWLQERYLAAMRHCYRRLKTCKAVIGWGTMNEPHQGFIGYRDLEDIENFHVLRGPMPSPLQAMAAASGHTVSVPVYALGVKDKRITGRRIMNPQGLSLFREGYVCPWKQAGVWTDEGGEPRILKKDHFTNFEGRPVRFVDDFLKPFNRRFIERIREVNEKAFIFVEGIPHGDHPSWTRDDPSGVVNAFHHYDGPTLYLKFFRPWFSIRTDNTRPVFGRKRVAALLSECLAAGVEWTRNYMGDMPCLLGEFGLPFDMNHRRAYKNGGDPSARYRLHEEALSMYYDAVDRNLLHSAIWHYCATNTPQGGDGWNDEDLSIVSQGEARALKGWLRPYPMATAGVPLFLNWDRKREIFTYRFRAEADVEGPTEIFLPPECFGSGPVITAAISAAVPEAGPPRAIRKEYRPDLRRIFLWNEGYTGELILTVTGKK
jgi:hypothetical protein